jgi:hypothetical protein
MPRRTTGEANVQYERILSRVHPSALPTRTMIHRSIEEKSRNILRGIEFKYFNILYIDTKLRVLRLLNNRSRHMLEKVRHDIKQFFA